MNMVQNKTIGDLKLTIKPLTVPETDSVDNLLEQFTSQPTMRVIYAVDAENRLVGIIDRKKIFSLIFAEHTETPERISDLYHIVSARTAGDLCHRNVVVVRPDDTVAMTVRIMLQKKFFELPVVDENGSPIATLTIWDVLKAEKEEE